MGPADYERLFLYAFIWTVAGILEADDRSRVDKFLRALTANVPEPATPARMLHRKTSLCRRRLERPMPGSR